jgi:hypothetical protein
MMRRLHALVAPLFSGVFWRATIAARQGRAFDRRHGTDTVERLPVAAMRDVPIDLARHAVHYEPSALPKLQRALRVVVRTLGARLPEFSFVDIGSGKGLVVMLASRHPFRLVLGVEMAPELHAIAERNLARYRIGGRSAPSRVVQGDALRVELPPGNLVVYLYNPFDAAVLEPFVDRLADVAADGRELLIVYVNPQHAHLLEDPRRLEPVFADAHLRVYRWRTATAVAASPA